MDCGDVRTHLIDLSRRRLPRGLREEVERHLQGCPACQRALEVEGALDNLLERSAPRPPAPAALRDRLAGLVSAGAVPASPDVRSVPPWARGRRLALPALAAGLALALGVLVVDRRVVEASRAEALLTDELVNDHLRVLAGQRPAEIESGGPHQVKPWFEGRLDFAPEVPVPALAELQLRGGAVGYVLDRRAAVLQYTLRLHRLTLLVVRAEGLPWPPGVPRVTEARGFHVVRWRAGPLGYALVSDVGAGDLAGLADSFQAATGR
jgi:anti-sigma factor (TIGR02949 family)